MAELSIVIPCFNEAGNLAALIDRYRAVARHLSLELILVDNGSTDATPQVLTEQLARPENSFVRKVRVDKNIGYGHGLKSGLAQATATVLAISHADLQCPPEDLRRAFDAFKSRPEIPRALIKGRRRDRRAWPDRCVTWIYNSLARYWLGIVAQAMDKPVNQRPDVNAEPKLFARDLLADVMKGPDDFAFDLFILWSAKRRSWQIYEFEVAYEARSWGKSKLAANPWVRLKTSWRAWHQMLLWRLG